MTPKERSPQENTFSDTSSVIACFSGWAVAAFEKIKTCCDIFTHIPRHAPFQQPSGFDMWSHLVELIKFVPYLSSISSKVSELHVAETESRPSALSRGHTRRYSGAYTAVMAVFVLHWLWCHGCSSVHLRQFRHLYENNLMTCCQTSSLGSPIIWVCLTSYAVTLRGALYVGDIYLENYARHAHTLWNHHRKWPWLSFQGNSTWREERMRNIKINDINILCTFVSWDWQSFGEFYA